MNTVQGVDDAFAVAIAAPDVLAFYEARSPEGIAVLKRTVDEVTDGGDHLLSQSLFYKQKAG